MRRHFGKTSCYLNSRCVFGLSRELEGDGSWAPRGPGGRCEAQVCGLGTWADLRKRLTDRWQDNISSLSCSLLSGRNCGRCICDDAVRVRFWPTSTWERFNTRGEARRSLHTVLLLRGSRRATQRLWSLCWGALRWSGENGGQCQEPSSERSGGEVRGRGLRLDSTQAAGSPQRSYRGQTRAE